MKSVFITSTAEYSGKTLFSIGLGCRLKRDGYKISYFKPLGNIVTQCDRILTDQDAIFVKDSLKLEDNILDMVPIVLTHDLFINGVKQKLDLKELEKRVKDSYTNISKDKDIVIIGGTKNLNNGLFLGLSGLMLAKKLDTKVLLIDPYNNEVCLDCILAAKESLGKRLVGVVINRVGPNSMDHVNRLIVPYLENNNVNVLGVIPRDPLLNAMTVGQLSEIIGGRIVIREDKSEEFVEGFDIGAMDVENAMKYFMKSYNKAVITGGHRADLILAALETSVKCLVLTGGALPKDIILNKAEEAGIPVISTNSATFEVVEKLEAASGKVRVREDKKIQKMKELLDHNFNFERFYKLMELKSD